MTLTAPSPSTAPVQDIEALFKEARQRRRRRIGWIILLVVVVGVATFAMVGTGHSLNHRSKPPAQSKRSAQGLAAAGALPREIVGWTSDMRLVAVSSRTGVIEQTLASHVSIAAPGTPDVTVTPNGTVFFDNDAAGGDQIFSVPITGGPLTHVAAGIDPELSPDGKTLAFVPAGPEGEAPYLAPTGGIAIAHVSGGGIGAVRLLKPGPAQLNQGLSDLSWSSDSRYLSFDLLQGSTDVTTSWTLRLGAKVSSLAAAKEIPLREAGLTWNGYWGTNANGSSRGVGVLTHQNGSQQVVTVNPASGRVESTLFAVPGDVCVGLPPSGPPSCRADFSNAISGDSSGHYILIAGTIPLVDSHPTTSGAANLYRWSASSHSLVGLTPQVLRATWGP